MTPAEVSVIADLVRRRSGVMVDADKLYLIESRLAPIARRQDFASVSDLVLALRTRQEEALTWAVVEAMASTETEFFRDREPFRRLDEEVLPALARAGRRTARLWSAGCASGQEPYSLAMLAEEGRGRCGMDIEIFASDLSERCLEKAEAGLYTQFEVQRGLPARLLIKYFDKADDHWTLKPELRQAVRLKRQNLLTDIEGEGPFDVILCRNVISAFEEAAARRVLEQMAGALAEDGCLILGLNERPPTGAFKPLPGRAGLYVRDPSFRAAA